ncbi:transcriptional repressor [Roseovarius sp. E0-M6]|uniref:transcriptional repressor n=1 Tax=Roseovarius sp. E0-M6 TaxID=3127118 RepID=UPI00300FC09A
MRQLAFDTHDHHRCIAATLKSAETQCAKAGLHFTPVRRRVLELLATEHRAMGAYELLDHLRAEGLGSQPPVIYRALDFLVGHGFAHKLERLNAFVACCHPGADHSPAFLICRNCDAVAEIRAQGARALLGDAAHAAGFAVDRAVIEAMGTCPACQQASDAPA